MAVFVDTSAIYASLSASDRNQQPAEAVWARLAQQREILITSNYVVLETISLVGRRLGPGAVRDFQMQVVPLLQVHWVDEPLHRQAMSAMLTAGDRDLSLVDCVSFEVMRRLGVDTAFTFDAHFAQQGFNCLPS